MLQSLIPCSQHDWPTDGLYPSSGLPRVSLKPPAQEVPHGGELGFQQAAEEAVLFTVPRCVWKSHPRGGVWICVWLCCRGMNGNGRQSGAPLYSATNGCHRQGGQLLLQSALLCQVNTLWRPRTPWPQREAPLSPQALLLPARAPREPRVPGVEDSASQGQLWARQGAMVEPLSTCPAPGTTHSPSLCQGNNKHKATTATTSKYTISSTKSRMGGIFSRYLFTA